MRARGSLNVLVTWEMGSGYGHLLRLKCIVDRLVRRGHRITLATRDVVRTRDTFPSLPCFQAPQHAGAADYPRADSLAQIMHNIGCGSIESIERVAASWRLMADLIGPDAVVMDFSPMALIAFQGLPVARILIDNGYSHPTDTQWTPSLQPWRRGYRDMHERIERRVLKNINRYLKSRDLDPVDRLPALFQAADSINLLTVPELDHTGPKEHVAYRGYFTRPGPAPTWPEANGTRRRLFVYLKSFAGLDGLLNGLAALDTNTLAVIPDCDPSLLGTWQGHSRIRVTTRLCDIRLAASQADLALTTGGDTVGIMLLGGTPVCVLPLFPEQRLTAVRAEATGAAVVVEPGPETTSLSEAILNALQRLARDSVALQKAREFAHRHAQLDPDHELSEVIAEIERLAAARAATSGFQPRMNPI